MSGPKHTPPHRRHLRTLRQWFGVDDPEIVWEWGDGRTFNARRALNSIERAMKKAESGRTRLAEALKGVMASFEAYTYLKEPPADPDEYDVMMKAAWEEALAALAAHEGDVNE